MNSPGLPTTRIPNLVNFPLRFFVNDLKVRHRSNAPRTPVDDVLPAIDQTFFVQPHERLAHRVRQLVAHREEFARPIYAGAQSLHLVEDGPAVVLLPLPHPLDEGLARHVAPVLAFGGQLPLHHHLRRDAGMVGARQPKRHEPAHAVPADDDVHLRLVQHVAHVQAPCDVRRWQGQGEHRLRRISRRRLHVEQLFLDPVARPAGFDGSRFVGLGKFVGHAVPFVKRLYSFDITGLRTAAERAQNPEAARERRPRSRFH